MQSTIGSKLGISTIKNKKQKEVARIVAGYRYSRPQIADKTQVVPAESVSTFNTIYFSTEPPRRGSLRIFYGEFRHFHFRLVGGELNPERVFIGPGGLLRDGEPLLAPSLKNIFPDLHALLPGSSIHLGLRVLETVIIDLMGSYPLCPSALVLNPFSSFEAKQHAADHLMFEYISNGVSCELILELPGEGIALPGKTSNTAFTVWPKFVFPLRVNEISQAWADREGRRLQKVTYSFPEAGDGSPLISFDPYEHEDGIYISTHLGCALADEHYAIQSEYLAVDGIAYADKHLYELKMQALQARTGGLVFISESIVQPYESWAKVAWQLPSVQTLIDEVLFDFLSIVPRGDFGISSSHLVKEINGEQVFIRLPKYWKTDWLIRYQLRVEEVIDRLQELYMRRHGDTISLQTLHVILFLSGMKSEYFELMDFRPEKIKKLNSEKIINTVNMMTGKVEPGVLTNQMIDTGLYFVKNHPGFFVGEQKAGNQK